MKANTDKIVIKKMTIVRTNILSDVDRRKSNLTPSSSVGATNTLSETTTTRVYQCC